MAGPIAGTRVLDLSERSLASMIAGMMLADLGAEVVRVEPIGGDPLRALPGTQVWLRGQKSAVVTQSHVKDGSWNALLASADVVLDTAQSWTEKPDLLEGWTPGPAQVFAIVTAEPQTAEEALANRRRAFEPAYGELLESRYGLMHYMRSHREAPVFLGFPHAANGAAWMLEAAILGALYERDMTGRGQVVTTSLLDGILAGTNAMWTESEGMAKDAPRGFSVNTSPRPTLAAIGMWQCGDGNYMFVHTMARFSMNRLSEFLGRKDFVDMENPTGTKLIDAERHKEMRSFFERTFRTKPARYWMEELAKLDVPCMVCNPPGDAMWLEQAVVNGMVDILPNGRRQIGKLAKFQRTPLEVGRIVPTVGEHTASLMSKPAPKAVLAPKPQITHSGKPSERVGPLDGILVVDFGAFVAGPIGPRTLADLGARVIKVEEPAGDPFRGQSALFMSGQRGKEGIAVDLKTEEGRAIVYDLVNRADVVYHNQRAGAAKRLFIDYESLVKVNPNIIYCHSSGYGNEGPWASLPAFEPLHSALAGALNRTAGEGNIPHLCLVSMDTGCGLTGATMVLAALVERARSGKGQYIEMPQTAVGFLAMSDVYFEGEKRVETFPLDKEQRGHAPTNCLYRTKGGGWVLIACFADKEWQGVRRALNIPIDGWTGYVEARLEPVGRSAVGAAVEQALAKLSNLEAVRCLEAEGVPVVIPMALNPARLALDPKMRQLGVIVLERQADFGAMWETGHSVRFATATRIHNRATPGLGQHTASVLNELGRNEPTVKDLIARKVVRASIGEPDRV